MNTILIASIPVILLVCGISIRFRRRRRDADPLVSVRDDGAEPPPPVTTDVDEDRLRADLVSARKDGDRARIEALEDRLRAHEYWKKRQSPEAQDDRRRVENQPKTISDWNTSEKRFNNLR